MINFENIPAELKSLSSFCLWRSEKRNGRRTKVPYDPKTGALARTNNSATFSDFETAARAYGAGGWDGIGFRVSAGIGAIDIDHCIRSDGTINDVAAKVLSLFKDSYFERSPSGTGLRGFVLLSQDFIYDKNQYFVNNREYGLEIYLPGATNRFVTVTGDVYRYGEVSRDMAALQSILDSFMKRKNPTSGSSFDPVSYLTDEQVLEHAGHSEKFRDLMAGRWQDRYESQSDADMALVSILAFWCGNIEEQIDRIFRISGLMRDKWDRQTGGSTYGALTIRNAVNSSTAIYSPIQIPTAEEDFMELSEFLGDVSRVTKSLESMQPHTNPRYGLGEIGIGYLFADFFVEIARFNRDRGIWYVYDGRIWRADNKDLAVSELAKRLADDLFRFALRISDEDTRKRFLQRVAKLQIRKNRRSMIEDAKSVYPISMSAFDNNKYLFNCENGTLDLSTTQFREHDPKDFITKISPVVYDAMAVCSRWEKFVGEVMEGKLDLIQYFQKAIGYSLSGDTSLECLFIMYGPKTRNGKTTALETLLKVMGEYGRSARPDMLASSKFGTSSNSPSEDVARLAGARFVGISEMEKKLVINASLTKQLTGNSSITARFLNENSFEFHIQAKIFIDTNHLPNVLDLTLFESGRMKIIPFNRHFKKEERDQGLKTTLSQPEALSGILNWCVEGYRRFKVEGLQEPEEVVIATGQYALASDRISQFVKNCLVRRKGSELLPKAIYNRYKDWCASSGYMPEGLSSFYERLKVMFVFEKRRPWTQGAALNATMFVNHVAWVKGEEPEEDFCSV